MVRRLAALLLVVAATGGCGASVRSGNFQIYEDDVDEQFPVIKRRAAFDLHCPPRELTLITLAVHEPSGDPPFHPNQVGVEGCGRRAVYVRRGRLEDRDWVLNSSGN